MKSHGIQGFKMFHTVLEGPGRFETRRLETETLGNRDVSKPLHFDTKREKNNKKRDIFFTISCEKPHFSVNVFAFWVQNTIFESKLSKNSILGSFLSFGMVYLDFREKSF